MSDNAQPVGATPEPTNSNPQPVGDAAQAKPSEPFKAYATAEDFEAHKAKLTEAKDRELAKMRAENEALRKKNETEQEKAIREAKEAGAAEAEARVKAAKLEAYLEAKGLTGASLKAALAVAPDEWEAVSEAGKVIEEALPGLFGSKSKTIDGGGGRAPTTSDHGDLTDPEYIQSMLDKPNGREWYEKNRAAIKAAQQRKWGGSSLFPR